MIAHFFRKKYNKTMHSHFQGRTVVYVVQGVWGGLIKIGISSTFYARVKMYDTSTPYGVHIIAVKDADSQFEVDMHKRFRKWLAWRTEWYLPNEELAAFLKTDPGWELMDEMKMDHLPVLPPHLVREYQKIQTITTDV